MEQNFIKYIYKFFKPLIVAYGFKMKKEINDGQSYSIEYSSKIFVIKIEKYRREFYVTFYKLDSSDKEINLFNLLSYLNRGTSYSLKAEYFQNEKDIDECYRKQLKYITTIIYDNYAAINDFFNSGDNYESKVIDLEKFIVKKYPELFKRT